MRSTGSGGVAAKVAELWWLAVVTIAGLACYLVVHPVFETVFAELSQLSTFLGGL